MIGLRARAGRLEELKEGTAEQTRLMSSLGSELFPCKGTREQTRRGLRAGGRIRRPAREVKVPPQVCAEFCRVLAWQKWIG